MPVPIPGSNVGSDTQKVKFLTIFGRPKTGIFDKISGVPGRAPLATNHATKAFCLTLGLWDPARDRLGKLVRARGLVRETGEISLANFRPHAGRGNIHIQCVPPRNHPGETVYPQDPPGISSSGPKNEIGGVFGHACAESGLKSSC